MVDLDFSNYQGPVKNPFAASGSTLAPRKVNRINVSREAVVTVQQVEVLAKTAQANDQITKAIVAEVEDQFPPKTGYEGLPGLRRPESIEEGHLAEVLAVARRILHEND